MLQIILYYKYNKNNERMKRMIILFTSAKMFTNIVTLIFVSKSVYIVFSWKPLFGILNT